MFGPCQMGNRYREVPPCYCTILKSMPNFVYVLVYRGPVHVLSLHLTYYDVTDPVMCLLARRVYLIYTMYYAPGR